MKNLLSSIRWTGNFSVFKPEELLKRLASDIRRIWIVLFTVLPTDVTADVFISMNNWAFAWITSTAENNKIWFFFSLLNYK